MEQAIRWLLHIDGVELASESAFLLQYGLEAAALEAASDQHAAKGAAVEVDEWIRLKRSIYLCDRAQGEIVCLRDTVAVYLKRQADRDACRVAGVINVMSKLGTLKRLSMNEDQVLSEMAAHVPAQPPT